VTKGGLDWKTINTCANGSEGDDLLLKAGQATKSLNPRLNWVPWVVINGVCRFTIVHFLKIARNNFLCNQQTTDNLKCLQVKLQ